MKYIGAAGAGIGLIFILFFMINVLGDSLAGITSSVPGVNATIGLGTIAVLFIGIVVIIAIVITKARQQ